MDADQRARVAREWGEGGVDVVVATIAFGAPASARFAFSLAALCCARLSAAPPR